jgi:hypothetical protein
MLRALAATARAFSAGSQKITMASGLKPTAISTPPVPAVMEIASAPLASRYASAAFVSGDRGAGLATARRSTTSSSISAISRKRWPHVIRPAGGVVKGLKQPAPGACT